MNGRTMSAREERLLRGVRELVAKCGPRPSGSDGERAAARYVADKWSALGLEVHLDAVQVGAYEHLPELVGCGMVALAAIALAWSAPVATLLSLLGTVVLFTEAAAVPTLSRYLPKRPSYNVVARRRNDDAAARTIVLVSHLDTARPTLFNSPRVATLRRYAFMFLINAAGIIFILAFFGSFTPQSNAWWVGFACGLYAIVHATVLVHGTQSMNATPGANDNASGLVVLTEMAERLHPLPHTDLWLVATCGHQSGLAGMRHFLQRYPLRRDTTGVINVQCVGAGTINLSLIEGYVRASSVSRGLLAAAAHAVKDAGLTAHARPYRGSNTEAYLALRSGLPAISVIGMDGRGNIPNWHWRTDTVENVDPASLDTAARLLEGMLARLDAGAVPQTPPISE